MADPQRQHKPARGERRGPAPAAQHPAQQPGPGLAAVEALANTAGAGPVVEIIHAHPDERDAILEWLHGHRGNAFVNQVTSRLGQVERGLPQGVELQHLRASVTIPGGKRLAGTWKADVGTTAPTRATD